jgi:hypothetical protein
MQGTSSQGGASMQGSPPTLPRILNLATDRLDQLDRRGEGHGPEARVLNELVAIGIRCVEEGILSELPGAHDPPRFAWPDRPAPFANDAA